MSLPYPPGPAEVPKDFTRPTREYRMQVALVLGSLLISFLVYLTMLAGAAWLCYWLVTAPWPNDTRGSGTFFRIVGIVCSALLFLYLLKGLFKSQKFNESLFLEIKESDQPELFAFIRRICAETRAPLPRKVFVSPEVNAAVLNNTSILSLVWPTSRDLLIGLGLVNMVNLSEFKAVLAHEFGHFSQKSMKLGSYVYVANKVMIDIVYGRDWLDHLMSQIKGIDLRIAIFVWAFLGVLWVLRKVLEGVFKVINLFNLSLMRHMEFNADRMAVSVAGSDAVVHCLLRSAFADQAFLHVRNDLWAAADHDLYTRDLFAHQIPAAEMIRRRAKNPQLGLPPAERGPNMEVFKPEEGDAGIPLMWSTHPPNHDRERNAKAIYLFAEIDERSPWLLFRDKDQLRFLVTQRYYEEMHKPARSPRYSDSERVQNFFNEEFAETTYPDRFQGFYDNRHLVTALL